MIVGELYQVKSHYWLMFASLEIMAKNKEFLQNLSLTHSGATNFANHYSNRLNCKVDVISENDVFALLEIQEYKRNTNSICASDNSNFVKVLSINGDFGWMIVPCSGFYCFKLLK